MVLENKLLLWFFCQDCEAVLVTRFRLSLGESGLLVIVSGQIKTLNSVSKNELEQFKSRWPKSLKEKEMKHIKTNKIETVIKFFCDVTTSSKWN